MLVSRLLKRAQACSWKGWYIFCSRRIEQGSSGAFDSTLCIAPAKRAHRILHKRHNVEIGASANEQHKLSFTSQRWVSMTSKKLRSSIASATYHHCISLRLCASLCCADRSVCGNECEGESHHPLQDHLERPCLEAAHTGHKCSCAAGICLWCLQGD